MAGQRRSQLARARAMPLRSLFALAAVAVGLGLFSSSVGSGALPASSLPMFGVTNGDGSLSTVAELGDINGDGFGDYAVGLPSSDVGGTDSGIVYVFLGQAGALGAGADLAQPGRRLLHDHGPRGRDARLLDRRRRRQRRRPQRHRHRRADGRRAQQERWRRGLRRLRLREPRQCLDELALGRGPHERPGQSQHDLADDPRQPLRRLHASTGTRACRWRRSPTSTATGCHDLAVGAPDAGLHPPGGGGVAVLYGKPPGVHITLNDLWENGYPYFFHIDFPPLANQHVGTSVASVGRHDRRRPARHRGRRAAGRLQRQGRLRLGLDHQRPPAADRRLHPGVAGRHLPVDQAQQPRAERGLSHRRRRRRAISWAARWPASATRTATASATSRSAPAGASPAGRAGAGEVVVVAGQADAVTRDLAVTAPLQTIIGARGRCRARRVARRCRRRRGDGHVDMVIGAPGDSSSAGAVYLVLGARRHHLRPRPDCSQDRARGRGRDERQLRSRPARRSTAPVPTR